MRREALLAVAVVLAASSDWGLSVGERELICAKSRDACELARSAIAKGWIDGIPNNAATSCSPAPGCFSDRENCIEGYHGQRTEGYCR